MLNATPPFPPCSHPDQPTLLLRSRPHWAGLLQGVLDQARQFGWRPVDLAVTDGVIPRNCRPAGAIVGRPVDQPDMQWVGDLPCPVVRIGHLPHELDFEVPAVISDVRAAGRLAAEHFAQRHFEHVAFVGNDPWSDGRPMYEAFRQRAEQLGCTCHLLRVTTVYDEATEARYLRRSRELEQWLSKVPRPLAVFTYSDRMAASIGTMLDSAGVAVPEEVALLSYGNVAMRCELAPVELSSIDYGSEAIGREAVRLLHRLVHGEQLPNSPVVIAPAGVVERQSTKVLAVSDPIVARAMRYIWNNLDLQIRADDIAAQVGVPRRALDRAFRATLGRTVNAERLRKRLERCAQLLASSDMSVEDVAAAAGFPSRSYMYRAFRKRYRVSPGEYRNAADLESDITADENEYDAVLAPLERQHR